MIQTKTLEKNKTLFPIHKTLNVVNVFLTALFSIYSLQTQEVQTTSVHLTEPQRALLGYISAGQEAISRAGEELRTKVSSWLLLVSN